MLNWIFCQDNQILGGGKGQQKHCFAQTRAFQATSFHLWIPRQWLFDKNQDLKWRKWQSCGKGISQKGEGLAGTWRRIYVPKNKHLQEDIIREHHDSVAAGHPGWYKTQELITRNYWWPYIQLDIRKYIDGCEMCQRTKVHHKKPKNPLHSNEVPSRPWEHISVDLIGELPES